MSDGEHSELTDTKTRAGAAGIVLVTLAAGQFLMTLDSSVMNVSIATVAKDVGTTVTGIQTAITFYTLVMASLMITGGKFGQILGRKRAFAIGCVIYGCGSLITALSPNLAVLMVGWSVLEGVGAALIILAFTRRIADTPAEAGARLDLVGTVLSALGLALIVYGILRAGTWGFVQPKEGAPQWVGLLPVIWLILGGGVVLRVFMWW